MTLKNFVYLLLGILLLLIIFNNIDGCSSDRRFKQEINKLEKQNESYAIQIQNYRDSVSKISQELKEQRSKKDTIIKYREVTRKESSNKISQAKRTTKTEADSILNARFESSTDILVDVIEHDSLRLEVRSITDLYNQEIEINKSLMATIEYKDTIIQNQDFLITNQTKQLQLFDDALKNKKKKKFRAVFNGFAIGVGIGAVGTLAVASLLLAE